MDKKPRLGSDPLEWIRDNRKEAGEGVVMAKRFTLGKDPLEESLSWIRDTRDDSKPEGQQSQQEALHQGDLLRRPCPRQEVEDHGRGNRQGLVRSRQRGDRRPCGEA